MMKESNSDINLQQQQQQQSQQQQQQQPTVRKRGRPRRQIIDNSSELTDNNIQINTKDKKLQNSTYNFEQNNITMNNLNGEEIFYENIDDNECIGVVEIIDEECEISIDDNTNILIKDNNILSSSTLTSTTSKLSYENCKKSTIQYDINEQQLQQQNDLLNNENLNECRRSQRKKVMKYDVRDLFKKRQNTIIRRPDHIISLSPDKAKYMSQNFDNYEKSELNINACNNIRNDDNNSNECIIIVNDNDKNDNKIEKNLINDTKLFEIPVHRIPKKVSEIFKKIKPIKKNTLTDGIGVGGIVEKGKRGRKKKIQQPQPPPQQQSSIENDNGITAINNTANVMNKFENIGNNSFEELPPSTSSASSTTSSSSSQITNLYKSKINNIQNDCINGNNSPSSSSTSSSSFSSLNYLFDGKLRKLRNSRVRTICNELPSDYNNKKYGNAVDLLLSSTNSVLIDKFQNKTSLNDTTSSSDNSNFSHNNDSLIKKNDLSLKNSSPILTPNNSTTPRGRGRPRKYFKNIEQTQNQIQCTSSTPVSSTVTPLTPTKTTLVQRKDESKVISIIKHIDLCHDDDDDDDNNKKSQKEMNSVADELKDIENFIEKSEILLRRRDHDVNDEEIKEKNKKERNSNRNSDISTTIDSENDRKQEVTESVKKKSISPSPSSSSSFSLLQKCRETDSAISLDTSTEFETYSSFSGTKSSDDENHSSSTSLNSFKDKKHNKNKNLDNSTKKEKSDDEFYNEIRKYVNEQVSEDSVSQNQDDFEKNKNVEKSNENQLIGKSVEIQKDKKDTEKSEKKNENGSQKIIGKLKNTPKIINENIDNDEEEILISFSSDIFSKDKGNAVVIENVKKVKRSKLNTLIRIKNSDITNFDDNADNSINDKKSKTPKEKKLLKKINSEDCEKLENKMKKKLPVNTKLQNVNNDDILKIKNKKKDSLIISESKNDDELSQKKKDDFMKKLKKSNEKQNQKDSFKHIENDQSLKSDQKINKIKSKSENDAKLLIKEKESKSSTKILQKSEKDSLVDRREKHENYDLSKIKDKISESPVNIIDDKLKRRQSVGPNQKSLARINKKESLSSSTSSLQSSTEKVKEVKDSQQIKNVKNSIEKIKNNFLEDIVAKDIADITNLKKLDNVIEKKNVKEELEESKNEFEDVTKKDNEKDKISENEKIIENNDVQTVSVKQEIIEIEDTVAESSENNQTSISENIKQEIKIENINEQKNNIEDSNDISINQNSEINSIIADTKENFEKIEEIKNEKIEIEINHTNSLLKNDYDSKKLDKKLEKEKKQKEKNDAKLLLKEKKRNKIDAKLKKHFKKLENVYAKQSKKISAENLKKNLTELAESFNIKPSCTFQSKAALKDYSCTQNNTTEQIVTPDSSPDSKDSFSEDKSIKTSNTSDTSECMTNDETLTIVGGSNENNNVDINVIKTESDDRMISKDLTMDENNSTIRRSDRIKTITQTRSQSVGIGLVKDKMRLKYGNDDKWLDSDDKYQSSTADLDAKNVKFLEEKQVLNRFQIIKENEYRCERIISKEAKRMTCDCFLTREEAERGELGCGEDCLNRLLMIECGPICTVGDRCTNRRFQRIQNSPCKVFKTEKKGFGLMANLEILPGQFIMEYVGEVLNTNQFEKRAKIYSEGNSEHYYFMALRSDAIIDATQKGNISRFINHSCDPNAETQKWTVNGELRIGFFSTRHILPGEEITFDYQFQRYGREAQKCFCESSNCRGWIGEEPDSEYEEEEEEISEEEETEKLPSMEAAIDKIRELEQKESILLEIGKPLKDDITDIKKIPTPKPPIIRKRRVKKIKNKTEFGLSDAMADYDLEKDIASLMRSGLKNQVQTLCLSRLMVRAKSLDSRKRLLEILRKGESPCRRLFLDYHGLRLLHGWMIEIDPNDLEFRHEIVITLETLPIPNKTMLKDSKVFHIVQSWANNKIAEGSPNDSPKNNDGILDLNTNNGTIIKEDEKKLPIKINENDIHNKIIKITNELIISWENLPEVFRIPKRERIEQMKEHEREADRQYKALNPIEDENERLEMKRNKERFGEKRKFRRSRDSPDRKRPRQNRHHHDSKGYDKSTLYHMDARLSKEHWRQLFEAQVAKDEADKRLTEERRELEAKYKFFDLDPNLVMPQDLPFCVNTETGQWYTRDNRPVETPPSYAHIQPTPYQHLKEYKLPEMDLPPFWKFAIDPNGRIYYYHIKIRIPQWEPPIKILPLENEEDVRTSTTLNTTTEDDQNESDSDDDSTDSAGNIVDPAERRLSRKKERYNLLVQERTISPRREEDRMYNQMELRKYKENKEKIRRRKEEMKRRRLMKKDPEENPIKPILNENSINPISSTAPPIIPTTTSSINSIPNTILKDSGLLPLPIQEYLISSDEDDKEADCVVDNPLIDKFVKGDKIVDELDALNKDKPLKRQLPIIEKDENKKRSKLSEDVIRSVIYGSSQKSSSLKKRKDSELTGTTSQPVSVAITTTPTSLSSLNSPLPSLSSQPLPSPTLSQSSMSSSASKKVKANYLRRAREKFRSDIAGIIVQHLQPYRKSSCTIGRITNNDDFKHLARKLTHFVMVKELKHCDSTGQTLVVTESVKNKSREFIKKYMAKYGDIYIRPVNDPEFKDIPH